MRRSVVVLSLLCLLAATVAVAGCGAGGNRQRNDYVKALNRAQAGLTQRFTSLQQRITPTSTPTQDRRTLQAYENAVRVTVRDLRSVQPPAGFGDLHRRFVGQVAGYGTALASARRRLRGSDPQQILTAQARLRASIERTGVQLDATIRAINDKLKG